MIRSALTLGLLLPAMAFAETMETNNGTYTLGENGNKLIQLIEITDTTESMPYGGGWGLYRAEAQDLYAEIPEGYETAELKGIYAKDCNSDVWKNINDITITVAGSEVAVFALDYFSEDMVPGEYYSLDIVSYGGSIEPAGQWTAYECAAQPISYYSTGDVTFGYVLEFTEEEDDSSTGTCESDPYIDQIAHAIEWGLYRTGDRVQNVGKEYECIEGGWCTIGADYAPGVGWAWPNAWVEVQTCE